MAAATADQPARPASHVRWSGHRPRGPLDPGCVEVWRADLSTVAEELTGLVSDAERTRAARMVRAPAARLWMRGRGVLRALLAGYLELDARSLLLVEGPHGKPVLEAERATRGGGASRGPQPGLSFNLSHSGAIAVYAFSRAGPVGVDVELSGRPRDTAALAARLFGAGAEQRLRRLDPTRAELEFLRMWVRHEAALKCEGTGLGAVTKPVAGDLWIANLDVGACHAGALALEAPPRELRCRTWSGEAVVAAGAREASARGS